MPPWSPPYGYCWDAEKGSTLWTEDKVFCYPFTGDLWQLTLYLALLLWVFLTALTIFQSFEWRGLSGFSLADVIKIVGRQVVILLAACCSFELLLLAHQLIFLLVNSLVGSLPAWQVTGLWGKLDGLIQQSQTAVNTIDPNGGLPNWFGGNLPDGSGPFGLTWTQVFQGLGSFETFVDSALIPIRFVALFVAVTTAPLGVLAYGSDLTRRFFLIWLEFWLEVEALAVGSALIIAAWQEIHFGLSHNLKPANPYEPAFILLGLCGLVCGANLAFIWKIVGQFLSQVTGWFQQQAQRNRQLIGVGIQTAVGLAGLAATAATGGAALPFALGAEALVSGVQELGAPPGSATPGAGTARSLLAAGEARVRYTQQQEQMERQDRLDAERAADRQEAKQYRQEQRDRQDRLDAERAARGSAGHGNAGRGNTGPHFQGGGSAGSQPSSPPRPHGGTGGGATVLPPGPQSTWQTKLPPGPLPSGTPQPPNGPTLPSSGKRTGASQPTQPQNTAPHLPPTGSRLIRRLVPPAEPPGSGAPGSTSPSTARGPGENHPSAPSFLINGIAAGLVRRGGFQSADQDLLQSELKGLYARRGPAAFLKEWRELATYLDSTAQARTRQGDQGYQEFLKFIQNL